MDKCDSWTPVEDYLAYALFVYLQYSLTDIRKSPSPPPPRQVYMRIEQP